MIEISTEIPSETLGETKNNSVKQRDNSYFEKRPWLFKPGQSGNPKGRPKGTITLKEYARKFLEGLSDEEKQEFMKGLPKEVIWKMAEGNPSSDMDLSGEIVSKIIKLDE